MNKDFWLAGALVGRNARLGSASFLTGRLVQDEINARVMSRNARLGSASFLTCTWKNALAVL
mgnify:CR=1 FL=1